MSGASSLVIGLGPGAGRLAHARGQRAARAPHRSRRLSPYVDRMPRAPDQASRQRQPRRTRPLPPRARAGGARDGTSAWCRAAIPACSPWRRPCSRRWRRRPDWRRSTSGRCPASARCRRRRPSRRPARRRFLRDLALRQSQALGRSSNAGSRAAAEGDFVIALYNPASKRATAADFDAFALLRGLRRRRDAGRLCPRGRPARTTDLVTTLGEADPGVADMSTLVLVGAATTRLDRAAEGAWPRVTPRSYGAER